jgi:AbrB family looped-hinge helix DNA binding protein
LIKLLATVKDYGKSKYILYKMKFMGISKQITTLKTHLDKGGRVVIPAACRRELGLKTGDELLVRVQDGQIHLQTLEQAVLQGQALVRQYAGQRQLTEELIAERRKEAQSEEA